MLPRLDIVVPLSLFDPPACLIKARAERRIAATVVPVPARVQRVGVVYLFDRAISLLSGQRESLLYHNPILRGAPRYRGSEHARKVLAARAHRAHPKAKCDASSPPQ